MKIIVNEQPQRFYLALDNWFPAVGHGIQIGEIQLCAVPLNGSINISEVTSGAKIMIYELNFIEYLITEDKEGFLTFLQHIGKGLAKKLGERDDLGQQIEKMQAVAFDKLGPMPAIEDVDVEELLEKLQE